MKKLILICSLLVTAITINAQQTNIPKLTGPYLGQKLPGMKPEIFAPGFISTKEYGELNSVFTEDGKEFYFSRRGVPGKFSSIMVTRIVDGIWTLPEPVNFSDKRDDIDLFILSGGQSMIFSSETIKGNMGKYSPNHDFMISKRIEGGWSNPVPFAENAVSEFEDYYPVVTKNGNLYFNSQRSGLGTNDIYCSKYIEGAYSAAVKLPEPINTKYREFDAFLTQDENMIIFSSEKPGGFGRSDLYISIKDGSGQWSKPNNLGENINSIYSEYGAAITPDGKYLFFTSNRNGTEDIYWVSMSAIEKLLPGK